MEALSRVHDLAEARVYSRNPANVEAYVKTMRSRVDADLVACASAAEAVRGADIVVTATSAAGPVLLADNLAPGAHVVAMGSNNPAHGELEPAAVARIDRVFVDDLDGAHEEAGDLIAAARAGVFQWGQAIEFAGWWPGRWRVARRTRKSRCSPRRNRAVGHRTGAGRGGAGGSRGTRSAGSVERAVVLD